MSRIFLFLLLFAHACKLPGNNSAGRNTGNTFRLQLHPPPGAEYHYDVSTTTTVNVSEGAQAMESRNNSTVGITYLINRDSSGNYRFQMHYDNIRLYLKNGESEMETDADNAALFDNPLAKMLAQLKSARLTAVVTPLGVVREIAGYRELAAQLMEGLPNDPSTRQVAQQHLDNLIGEAAIRQNFDQLFRMFPDSAIHVGDKWKLNTTQSGQANLRLNTNYFFEDVSDGLATITAESDIASDEAPAAIGGYAVSSDLKGAQKASYVVDVSSGMLLNASVKTDLAGTFQTLNRRTPVTMKINVEMKGRKVR